jgi:hypothetical protein
MAPRGRAKLESNSPVLVTGMHRSGTTLVARIMSTLGIDIGPDVGKNLESRYFQTRNEWVLRRLGGAWDNPASAVQALKEPALVEHLVNEFTRELTSPRLAPIPLVSFGGRRRALRAWMQRARWAWKDPRTCITLKVWERVFDAPRLIVITRDGRDVARSLWQRACREQLGGGPGDVLRQHSTRWRLRELLTGGYERYALGSLLCTDAGYAFRLWETYVQCLLESADHYAGPALWLRYEDLLRAPTAGVEEIRTFCGITPTAAQFEAATELIDRGRPAPCPPDATGRMISALAQASPLMHRLGYDAPQACDEPQV